MTFDFERVFRQLTPFLLDAVQVTVYVSVVSIVLGMIVGLISCLMVIGRFRVLRILAEAYVWVIRGTPMIVQALLFFFGINSIFLQLGWTFRFTPVNAGILTVTLNAGAYFTEIFRAGIAAVDKGQNEAARSLGLTPWKAMYKVILPQALRISLPPTVNQWIISTKDTAILSIIGVGELTNLTQVYAFGQFVFFESFIYVAFWYLAILSVLMILAKKLEKWVSYDRKN
ncbi:MAG: amino acid ABC transporter permease [Defluviitaleaceae bacterium]|nr:amino acid ABC transporter permease [Defluviitaleaceae bacterium]